MRYDRQPIHQTTDAADPVCQLSSCSLQAIAYQGLPGGCRRTSPQRRHQVTASTGRSRQELPTLKAQRVENLGSRQADGRLDKNERNADGQRRWFDLFSTTRANRGTPMDEKRNIRPDVCRDHRQATPRVAKPPSPIGSDQRGGSIA